MIGLHEALAQATVTQDEAEGRVYGWIPGIVTDIDTKLMQVKARIGKQSDNESTHWLVPMLMGGCESVPEVGDPIGVQFHDGDVHRGAYFYFPQSNSSGRPTEWMVLGTTFAGVINQLVTDVQTLTTAYMAHKHTGVTTGPGSSAITDTPVFAPSFTLNAGKIQAADGSVVAPKSGNQKALSKRGKLR